MGRFGARVLASFVAVVALVGLVLAPLPTGAIAPAGAASGTPIMSASQATVPQMVAWFNATTRSPYRASVPIDQLAGLYLSEGAAAGVRGDIAFAQSILETGWFSFPGGGYVQPTDNNFAGIGAYGDGSHLFRAPTAQMGVRGQVQLLRRYADPNSRSWNIGYPPVPQLWPNPASYNTMDTTHGWAPTWESLSGTWASSTTYGATILRLYNSMLTYNGLSITGCPPASLAIGATASATARCPASTAMPGRAVVAHPGGGYYVLNGNGAVTVSPGCACSGNGPLWTWDIARAIAAMPDGNGYVILDGWGGVHPFGSAVAALAGLPYPYWQGWDIARGIALSPDGKGYVVLDGWGGVHAVGDEPQFSNFAYWRGWDIVRAVVLDPDGQGGYTLDGWGNSHPFGNARPLVSQGQWTGWDIARAFQVAFDGNVNPIGWALLDGFGGLHVTGSLRQPNQSGAVPADVWRGVAFDSGNYVEVRNDGTILTG